MLRCFPKVACFLLCKCRGADVTDIVQPLFLKPIQQLQDFDEGFHEFRCEFCGREDTSADALVEGLCFLHTFKTCLIFFLYSKHSTVTNRACHWKEPINWRSPMCRKLQLCWQDPNFTLPALDIHYWRECPMLSACQFCEQVPSSTNFEESNELHYDLHFCIYV